MSVMRTRFWLLLAVLAISACGFKLRDAYDIPSAMRQTYVEGSERSEVYIGLQRALRSSGVTVTQRREEAAAVLRLSAEKTGRRVLSVGRDARVSEYEVYYSITFDVRRQGEDDKSYIIEPQDLRLTREYVYDETGVLGKSDEEALLRQEMQRDLVRLIMYRIEAASS